MLLGEMKSMKLGLEAISAVHKDLGSPADNFKSVHIAGTNGKGSVSWKIASGLQQAGLRVGLFTSPHLIHPEERIRINFKPIDQIGPDLPYKLTYFEMMTMKAFVYFAEQNVDYAVIEVGLGGRLDATNIITPKLAVITSIGFDHMSYLGDTLEQITREKAGIMKQGVPTIVGPSVNINAEKVEGPFKHFEQENCAIAKRALEKLGFYGADLSIVPPGRFQKHENIIFDVAHNMPAMEALIARLKLEFPKKHFRFLVSFSEGKEHEKMLDFLKSVAVEVCIAHTTHERLVKLGSSDIKTVFQTLAKKTKIRGEMLIVTGSHFMMEDLLEFFS